MNILELVGNTPVVELKKIFNQPDSFFYGLKEMKHMESTLNLKIFDRNIADLYIEVKTENSYAVAAYKGRKFVGISSNLRGKCICRDGIGNNVIGFYHSPPDHPSAPSGYDKDHVLPFYSYVFVPVDNGKARLLTSWELKNDRIDFVQGKIN